jgi:hypothetical protein
VIGFIYQDIDVICAAGFLVVDLETHWTNPGALRHLRTALSSETSSASGVHGYEYRIEDRLKLNKVEGSS